MSRVIIIKLKNSTQSTKNSHLDNFRYNLKFLNFLRFRVYVADDP